VSGGAERAPSPTLRLAPGAAIWRQVGDEVVILGLERSEYLATNPAGSLLWPLLEAGANVEQLIGALMGSFGLSAEQARADAESFVAALRSQVTSVEVV